MIFIESNLTRRISGMQIGNEGRPVNDIAPLSQTARVQQGKDGRKFTYANVCHIFKTL